MYRPKYVRIDDPATIHAFVRQHNFATLIGSGESGLIASHIPLELTEGDEGAMLLNGHLARANPQCRVLRDNAQAMAVFLGPHTYVTSRWYSHINVPTWNYAAVHAYGTVRIVEERDELVSMVGRLMGLYETGKSGLKMDDFPPEFLEKELRGIVGFQLRIERFEAAFKLSQNREDADYAKIIAELEKRDDADSKAIAALMREQRPSKTT